MTDNAILDLATSLQVTDPTDAAQVAEAERRAGAMLHMAMAFIQNRRGQEEAGQLVRKAFDDVAIAVGAQPAPEVEQAVQPVPTVAPSSVPTLFPALRRANPLSVQGRAETMLDFLERWRTPAEAEREAQGAIWASAAYLHRHGGEEKTADYLRFIMAQMSRVAWFEQLPVASPSRH